MSTRELTLYIIDYFQSFAFFWCNLRAVAINKVNCITMGIKNVQKNTTIENDLLSELQ